jgi:hypothetical protein
MDFDFDFGAPMGILGDVLEKFDNTSVTIKEALQDLVAFDVIDLVEHPQWNDLIDRLKKRLVLQEHLHDEEVLQLFVVIMSRFLHGLDIPFQREDTIQLSFIVFESLINQRSWAFSATFPHWELLFVTLLNQVLTCTADVGKSSNKDTFDAYLKAALIILLGSIHTSHQKVLHPLKHKSILKSTLTLLTSFRRTAVIIVSAELDLCCRFMNIGSQFVETHTDLEYILLFFKIVTLIWNESEQGEPRPLPSIGDSVSKRRKPYINKLFSADLDEDQLKKNLSSCEHYRHVIFPAHLQALCRSVLTRNDLSSSSLSSFIKALTQHFRFIDVISLVFDSLEHTRDSSPTKYAEMLPLIPLLLLGDENDVVEVLESSSKDAFWTSVSSMVNNVEVGHWTISDQHALLRLLLRIIENVPRGFAAGVLQQGVAGTCTRLAATPPSAVPVDLIPSLLRTFTEAFQYSSTLAIDDRNRYAIQTRAVSFVTSVIDGHLDTSSDSSLFINILHFCSIAGDSTVFDSIVVKLWSQIERLPAVLESSGDVNLITHRDSIIPAVRDWLSGFAWLHKQSAKLSDLGAFDVFSDLENVQFETVTSDLSQYVHALSPPSWLSIRPDLWRLYQEKLVVILTGLTDLYASSSMIQMETCDESLLGLYQALRNFTTVPLLAEEAASVHPWNDIVEMTLNEAEGIAISPGQRIRCDRTFAKPLFSVEVAYFTRRLLRWCGWGSDLIVFQMANVPLEVIVEHLWANQLMPLLDINAAIAINAVGRGKGILRVHVLVTACIIHALSIPLRQSLRKGIESFVHLLRQSRLSFEQLLDFAATVTSHPQGFACLEDIV